MPLGQFSFEQTGWASSTATQSKKNDKRVSSSLTQGPVPYEKGRLGSGADVEMNMDTGKEKERVELGSSFGRHGGLQKN